MSVLTFTSTLTYTPWVSGESLSPSNLNRHLSLTTSTFTTDTNVINPPFSQPISPVIGTVQSQTSNAGSPCVLSLYNPSSSTLTLYVYELTVWSYNGEKVFMRRTSSSTMTAGSGATIYTAPLLHLDQSNTSTIFGSLTGFDYSASSKFTETGAHWYGKVTQASGQGWQPTFIRPAGAFPFSVGIGQAIEITSSTTTSGVTIAATAVWDEI
jgi:hypothetical protein